LTPKKLAEDLKDFLIGIGSVDTQIIDGRDASARYPMTHAKLAILCLDKHIPTVYANSLPFASMACGSNGIFALPYGEHTILIFSDEDSHDESEIQNIQAVIEGKQAEDQELEPKG
jgi:hypothetical protein